MTMVILLHPSMHPDAETLHTRLWRTCTLLATVAVKPFELRRAMHTILGHGVKVVVPDGTLHGDGPFQDVIAALRLIQYPIQEATAYLASINAPAEHVAAPTNQQRASVGAPHFIR